MIARALAFTATILATLCISAAPITPLDAAQAQPSLHASSPTPSAIEIERRVAAAAALFEAEGTAALCQAISDPNGPFLRDEGYVFIHHRQGPLLCHPRRDLFSAASGSRAHIHQMMSAAERAKPRGDWTDYLWPHPDTREIDLKSTYCQVAHPLIICAGAFYGEHFS